VYRAGHVSDAKLSERPVDKTSTTGLKGRFSR
jgi:hypothetical protein